MLAAAAICIQELGTIPVSTERALPACLPSDRCGMQGTGRSRARASLGVFGAAPWAVAVHFLGSLHALGSLCMLLLCYTHGVSPASECGSRAAYSYLPSESIYHIEASGHDYKVLLAVYVCYILTSSLLQTFTYRTG